MDNKKDNKDTKDNKDDSIYSKITALYNIFILYLFSKACNGDILVDFINAIITNKGFGKIISAVVMNPLNHKEYTADKYSCLDVLITNGENQSFHIEIQIQRQKFFIGRMIYYWAKVYIRQIESKEDYGVLKPVTSIALIDFNIFKDKMMHHFGKIIFDAESEKDRNITDLLRIHFIELEKLDKNKPVEEFTHLEQWAYFLKHEKRDANDKKLEWIIASNPYIKRAHKEFMIFTSKGKYREMIEWAIEKDRVRTSELYEAKQEGRKEGKKEGMGERTLFIALNLKRMGMSTEQIMEATELSKEEVEKLTNK